jgi:hypothetical protein
VLLTEASDAHADCAGYEFCQSAENDEAAPAQRTQAGGEREWNRQTIGKANDTTTNVSQLDEFLGIAYFPCAPTFEQTGSRGRHVTRQEASKRSMTAAVSPRLRRSSQPSAFLLASKPVESNGPLGG